MPKTQKTIFLILLLVFLFFGSKAFAAVCNLPPAWNPTGSCSLDVYYEDPGGGSNLAGCYYNIQSGASPTCPSNGTWNSSCICSGLASITCPVTVSIGPTGNCNTSGAGACKICSKATDGAGNVGYGEQALNIDFTVPTVTVTGAPVSWQNNDTTASVSCSDADSGCDTGSYRLKTYTSSGSCSTVYSDYTLVSPQTISSHLWVCAAAKDNAGNEGFSPTRVEFKVDKTKPTSTITSPPAGSTQTTDFLVSVSDTDTGGSGLNVCYYRTYDSSAGYTRSWTTRICNSTQLITVSPTGDCRTIGGTCTVYIYSYDNAGNSSNINSRSFNITMEAVCGPGETEIVMDNFPSDGATITQTVNAPSGEQFTGGTITKFFATGDTNSCTSEYFNAYVEGSQINANYCTGYQDCTYHQVDSNVGITSYISGKTNFELKVISSAGTDVGNTCPGTAIKVKWCLDLSSETVVDNPPEITISCPECTILGQPETEIKNIGDVVSVTVLATDDYGLNQLYLAVGGDREGGALPNPWDDEYDCGGNTSCSHTWDITLDAFGLGSNWDWTFWGIAEDTAGQWGEWAVDGVRYVFDFNLSVSPNSGSVTQGESITTTITANLVSPATRSVSFSTSGLPSGASASFSPTSCSPTCNSTMTITTSPTTPAGTYPITIRGTNGNLVRVTTYNLTVNPACISHYSYSCYNNDVYWYDSCGNREEKKEDCGTGSWTSNYQCSGQWLQRQYHYKGCSGSSCYDYYGWVNYTDCGTDYCEDWGANYCKDNDVYHERTCHSKGCSANSCYDNTYTQEEKVQECGESSWQCCNNNCGRQYVDRGCSGGSCYSSPGACQDCGPYTCSAGSCTTICSQACGAECDENIDCLSDICRSDCTCEPFADTTPPVTAISPDGKDWGNSDVNFTLSCDDGAGSGCQTTQYKIIDQSQSCDISGLINGTSSTVTCPAGQTCQKKVCFRSIDNEGNEETIKTSNLFKVDKTKPTSTITSPPAGSTQTADFLVSVSDTDTGGSGLNICYYRTYDSVEGYTRSWTTRTCNSSQLITVGSTADCQTVGGTCTVYAYSYDNAGNQGDINNRSFNIGEVLIGEAPSCTYLGADPTEGPAPLTVSFIGSGSDPDGTVVAYQWDFGEGTLTTTTITDTFNDESKITSKENLTIDTTAGQVKLSGTKYEYYNTGQNNGSPFGGSSWLAQTFTPATAHKITSVKLLLHKTDSPGTITVSIRATDGSGHPTGADLCSGTTDGDTLPTGYPYEWREIVLGAGADLSSDTKYAIIVRASSGGGGWRLDTTPTYDRGNYEWSNNSGSSWSTSSFDFMFEDWGEPYVSSGTLTSTNLLSGETVTSIENFSYTASSVPDGTGLRAQFSQSDGENKTWYDSSGTLNGWDSLSQGTHTIDLSALNWSGPNFYYKMQFTSGSTPVLDEISLNIIGTTWDRTTSEAGTIYTYENPGVYCAKLRVQDNDGAWSETPGSCPGTCAQEITVTAANQPPGKPVSEGVSWDHCSIQALSIPTFNWTYSDPDGDPQSAYEVRIDNDSDFSIVDDDEFKCGGEICSGGSSPSFKPLPSEWRNWMSWDTDYWWIVRVKDNHNNWSEEWSDPSQFRTPLHAGPWPEFTPSPSRVSLNQVVTFEDNSKCYTSPGNSGFNCQDLPLISYQWDFDYIEPAFTVDNTTKGNATTAYGDLGNYKVKLRITDDIDTCYSETETVTVTLPLPEWMEIPPF